MSVHVVDALCVQVLPGIWKADIKAAFRRMPIRKGHRWAAVIVFRAEGKVCNVRRVTHHKCLRRCAVCRCGCPCIMRAHLEHSLRCMGGSGLDGC